MVVSFTNQTCTLPNSQFLKEPPLPGSWLLGWTKANATSIYMTSFVTSHSHDEQGTCIFIKLSDHNYMFQKIIIPVIEIIMWKELEVYHHKWMIIREVWSNMWWNAWKSQDRHFRCTNIEIPSRKKSSWICQYRLYPLLPFLKPFDLTGEQFFHARCRITQNPPLLIAL